MAIKCSVQISKINSSISGKIQPRRLLWVLGADWVKETADVHYRLLDPEYSYSARTFGIATFGTIGFKSANPSIMGRVRNALVQAFNKTDRIPDLVLVVLEDDILRAMEPKLSTLDDKKLSKDFSKRIKWLMSEYRKLIEGVKDVLAPNTKSTNLPKFLWIMPTRHVNYKNNFYRKKFAHCMETMAKFYENTTALRLVQRWDYNDNNLYLQAEQRFTYDGKAEFWAAVDKTVEFFDTKFEHKKPAETTITTDELRIQTHRQPRGHRGGRSGDRQEDRRNYSHSRGRHYNY